jgi:hypothetical protein
VHAVGVPGVEQAPQLALSVPVFTSQPFDAMPSQSAKPVLQVPRPHTPVLQLALALANTQVTPQPPQLLTSLPRIVVSQPGAAVQSPWFESQRTLQVEAVHTAMPPVDGHTFDGMQPPQ